MTKMCPLCMKCEDTQEHCLTCPKLKYLINQCEDDIFKIIHHQPCVMPISCEVECNKLGHEKNLPIRNFV